MVITFGCLHCDVICCKQIPQFSITRLAAADVKLGVDMISTEEVVCFGEDRY